MKCIRVSSQLLSGYRFSIRQRDSGYPTEPFPPDPHGDLGITAGERLELFPERSQYGWCFCVVIDNPSRRGWVSKDRACFNPGFPPADDDTRDALCQVPGNYVSLNGKDAYVNLDDQSAQVVASLFALAKEQMCS